MIVRAKENIHTTLFTGYNYDCGRNHRRFVKMVKMNFYQSLRVT